SGERLTSTRPRCRGALRTRAPWGRARRRRCRALRRPQGHQSSHPPKGVVRSRCLVVGVRCARGEAVPVLQALQLVEQGAQLRLEVLDLLPERGLPRGVPRFLFREGPPAAVPLIGELTAQLGALFTLGDTGAGGF